MTNAEFSSEFDILYNNIMKNGSAPGLDDYERSVFLTKALEEFVVALYSGKNANYDSFEKTEEIRNYLSLLVKTINLTPISSSKEGISSNSKFFLLPEDYLFLTYEEVKFNDSSLDCKNNTSALVIPITLDDYYKTKNNPFRKANYNRVLRLDIDDNQVELDSKYTISEYLIRYLSKPTPIILVDLTADQLSINGVSIATECKLNSIFHRLILDRAVQLAKIAYLSESK